MEKQIDEMAKQLYGNFGLTMPTARNIATYLTNKKGYRKASEIAEKIFTEIEAIIRRHDEHPKYQLMLDLDELKKKYTESEDTE